MNAIEKERDDRARAAQALAKTSGFACVECGHKFRTIKAAEKAAFGGDGCPKCGSSDIDIAAGDK